MLTLPTQLLIKIPILRLNSTLDQGFYPGCHYFDTNPIRFEPPSVDSMFRLVFHSKNQFLKQLHEAFTKDH